jgi:hypothetical protein
VLERVLLPEASYHPEPVLLVLQALLVRPVLPVRALEQQRRLPARLAHPARPVRALLRGPLRYYRCPAQDCFGCTQPKPTSQPKR